MPLRPFICKPTIRLCAGGEFLARRPVFSFQHIAAFRKRCPHRPFRRDRRSNGSSSTIRTCILSPLLLAHFRRQVTVTLVPPSSPSETRRNQLRVRISIPCPTSGRCVWRSIPRCRCPPLHMEATALVAEQRATGLHEHDGIALLIASCTMRNSEVATASSSRSAMPLLLSSSVHSTEAVAHRTAQMVFRLHKTEQLIEGFASSMICRRSYAMLEPLKQRLKLLPERSGAWVSRPRRASRVRSASVWSCRFMPRWRFDFQRFRQFACRSASLPPALFVLCFINGGPLPVPLHGIAKKYGVSRSAPTGHFSTSCMV